jgi:DNA polymerase-3 subunit epsilon
MGSMIDWPDAHVPLGLHPNPDDRRQAAAWALQRLVRRDFVIVDTETTGLGADDQVIEVAVVDASGKVLVERLVRPTCPIHPRATAVHGYDADALSSAPTFAEVLPELRACLDGSRAIAYNAPFDERLMRQSAAVWGAEPVDASWECAMRWYAQYVGLTSGARGGYMSPKLPRGDADQARHGARRDCLLTLRLLTRMALPPSG